MAGTHTEEVQRLDDAKEKRKITAYTLAMSSQPDAFISSCNDLLERGFQPYGKLKIRNADRMQLVQAFVKYEIK